ncbi:MAG: translation elongation factor Ts [Chloroflexi bacterium RBG_13_54_8]|nr:MAG: translation elongation factor Ts [Chloroflexi bacterium RBG_13_54_8]
MQIPVALIKELRNRTSSGVIECKKALEEAEGDLSKAGEILRERGLAKVEKKKDRVALQGLIEAYVHYGGRIGAMVEVNCETDFVAKTDEFKTLAHNLVLQVAATDPRFISAAQIPEGEKLNPEEVCLLEQPFIKDQTRKVGDLVTDVVAKVGEKVSVGRFARFELGG